MPDENTIFELTSRTIQARFLIRPSREINEIILGVIGRAQELYPEVSLYLFVFLSNHFEIIGSAPEFDVISAFVGYIKSNIARELGAIHDWKEKFWGRRFRAISVLDEPALLGRVQYVLSHGCKEDLVSRPGDWPGVQCVAALTEGQPLIGYWYDRTAAYNAGRNGKQVDRCDFMEQYEVRLTALPIWSELSEEERRQRFREIVRDIEQETRERHETDGTAPLGVERILAQDPHDRPDHPKRSPAPMCHAVSRRVRGWFKRSYRSFVEAYRRASERFRLGQHTVEFPVRCFRPPLPYLRRSVLAPAPAPG